MSQMPSDAPRSEDGQWWWDGAAWQPVDLAAAAPAQSLTPQEAANIEIDPPGAAAAVAPADHRQALIDGATNEARGRIVMIRQDMDKAVQDFNSRAHDATEDLKGKSESGWGAALFKILIDVVIVAIPGGAEVEGAIKLAEAGKEALKGFIDTFIEGVKRGEEQSAQGRVDEAKSELRRIATNLAQTAQDSAQAAEEAAAPLLGHAAESVLASHPDWAHIEPTQDNYGIIADHMGFVDPRVSMFDFKLVQGLDDQFHHEMTKIEAGLYFSDMNHAEALMHLLEDIEPTTNVAEYLRTINADVPFWERRVQLYHETYPGEAANAVYANRVIVALGMYPDAGPDAVRGLP